MTRDEVLDAALVQATAAALNHYVGQIERGFTKEDCLECLLIALRGYEEAIALVKKSVAPAT